MVNSQVKSNIDGTIIVNLWEQAVHLGCLVDWNGNINDTNIINHCVLDSLI